jgi:L-fuculose-phosphate aldolase
MNYNRKMLRFSSATSESELRLGIIECGRLCYDRGLTASNDGNISTRAGKDRILITPSGFSKGRMEAEDLILLSLEGEVVSAREGRRPSSETPMHLEVYKQRSDVRAVVHAHPVFATALTVAGLEFPNDVLPEVLLTLGDVPVTRYATPSSHDDADAIGPFLRDHNALLLRQHGSLTFGRDLEQALINLERVEHVAEVFWRAQMLGNVDRIPEEAREQLIAIREKWFKV